MRRASHIWIAIVLFTCALCAQGQSHVADSEKNQKRRTIYLKIKGPEESAAQMRTAFEKAVAEKDLLLADDRHKASSSIEITLQEKTAEGTLYADLISATRVARDGKTATVYSCKLVEDGKGYSTITKKKGKTGLIQPDIATKGTVFVEEAKEPAAKSLVEMVKKEIGEAGFQLITGETEADIRFTNIKLLKVPMHNKSVELRAESNVSAAGGGSSKVVTNVTLHSPVTEPIVAEAEDCRSSIEKVAQDASLSYGSTVSLDLAMVTQSFR
jgi:hypothetical protein